MINQFERRKKQQLAKSDRSSRGDVDEKIRELCEKINANDNFYTTSSCSGRIVLLKNITKKMPDLFIFVSHDKISFDVLNRELGKIKEGEVLFKQEPPILAIACKDIGHAGKILEIAREKAGWKNSGIMTIKNRIIVELRSTEYLSFPIIKEGKLLVDKDFLKIIVEEANQRLERGWEKIEKLIKEFIEI